MGIELHYATELTIQPIRGFENGGHHFPAVESPLTAVDEPPANVPSSPHYHSSGVITAHIAFEPNHCRLSAGRLPRSAGSWLYCMCMKAMPHPQAIIPFL